MKALRLIVPLLLVLLAASASLAATIHVPGVRPTVQAGIDAASPGDIVLVAPGTYVENIDYLGKSVRVESSAGAEQTVLDGGRQGVVVTFSGGETAAATLVGFTVRNGFGSPGSGIKCSEASPVIESCIVTGNESNPSGGGITLALSSPRIVDCHVTDNLAFETGGGLFAVLSSPVIEDCTIDFNDGSTLGGGVNLLFSDATIRNSTITENYVSEAVSPWIDQGGGIMAANSVLRVEGSRIVSNRSGDSDRCGEGGGIYSLNSTLSVTGTRISKNEVDTCTSGPQGKGGGAYAYGSKVRLERCRITENSGGGFFNERGPGATVVNCTIADNRSAHYAGGIDANSAALTLTHGTIANNSSGCCGGGISVEGVLLEVTNSIVWGNTAPEAAQVQVTFSFGNVTYSNVQGWWPGEGNVFTNPLFAGPKDYHLSPLSPCIGAGTAAGVSKDIDGDNRPLLFGIDIGSDQQVGVSCFIASAF